jgi:hypothetical protein
MQTEFFLISPNFFQKKKKANDFLDGETNSEK